MEDEGKSFRFWLISVYDFRTFDLKTNQILEMLNNVFTFVDKVVSIKISDFSFFQIPYC